MTILIALFIVGWVAAAVIGTQAYFRGEQSKLSTSATGVPSLLKN